MPHSAVDLQHEKCPSSKNACSTAGIQEWMRMVNAAGGRTVAVTINGQESLNVTVNDTNAKASFIEPQSGPWDLHACGLAI